MEISIRRSVRVHGRHFQEGQRLGQSLRLVVLIVGVHGLEVAVPSIKIIPNILDSDIKTEKSIRNVSSVNLLREQADSKRANASEDDERRFRKRERATNSWSTRRLETNPINLTEEQLCLTKRTILTQERNWKTIPRYSGYSWWSLSSTISRMVSKWALHFDQDALKRWSRTLGLEISVGRRIQGKKARKSFSESEWIDDSCKGSNEVRFENRETFQIASAYIRAIQGQDIQEEKQFLQN